MLIDSSNSNNGGSSSSGGGSGKDVGKLTHKCLNRGLPGRKQGTVRNQLGEKVTLSLEEHKSAAYRFPLPILRYLSYRPPSTGYTKESKDVHALSRLFELGRGMGKVFDRLTCLV